MTSQLLFSNVYFPLPSMVDSHQIFLSPMATPLSRSSVASTTPEFPIRSSTKIIRSSNIFVTLNTYVDDPYLALQV